MSLGTTLDVTAPVAGGRSLRARLLDDPAAGATAAHRGSTAYVRIHDGEDPAVHRAAADLVADLEKVTGATVDLGNGPQAHIVIGTIGQSPIVDEAIRSGALDVSPLRDEHGALRWEGFLVAVVDDVLHLVGTDRRGTIYAIYEFTEAIGVSPWYWWGDVPVRERAHVTFERGLLKADWPSVRYRGIFLNDEEEFHHWAVAHTPDGTIGPTAYRRLFELILRLKGNYLWAAMHVDAFNDDPENGRLANEMGVVIGTQHCDMLLRSNEHEFGPWVSRRGEHVEYDYSIPGRNRDLLREYWQGSVHQNRDYEVTWSVGMRGVHDSGFVTSHIDEDDSLSEAEKLTARVRLLEKVMHDQRQLLAEELGQDASEIPQLFIPYKEVLPLYDAGLEVPDDITMVWANDSFGHIRRFPDAAEQQRPGGHGLYYHSSYWSNFTTSYLATSSTPLALMKAELRRAWDRGIQRLWVDNIGGLKPLELEMEFFLRSAWEAGKETTTADVPAFTAEWIDAKFSGGHGAEAGAIYAEYYQLNDQRKIEHLTADVFPQTGYGDEAGRRLQRLQDLFNRTNAVMESLPLQERDAFFELFALKIHMAYITNAEFYFADRSTLALRQGKPAAADRYLAVSRSFAASARAVIDFYNHRMAGGRWSGMFTPHEFPPPVMPLYPAAAPATVTGEPGLGVLVWGSDSAEANPEITFSPHGIATKWIEVFNTGAESVQFTIDADPWIETGTHTGTVETETRISVRIDPAAAAQARNGTLKVRSTDTDESVEVTVRTLAARPIPEGFAGALEADGFVSIDPSRPERFSEGATSRWTPVSHLGRYGNDAMQVEPTESAVSTADDSALEFDIHLQTPGVHELELHRLPTLDATGRIRVGVSVDDHPMTVVESSTTDEHRGSWSQAIQDNVERLRVRLPALEVGAHVVRLHAIDPYVVLSKAVLWTGRPLATNLGPDFSARTDRPRASAPDFDPSTVEIERITQDTREHYGVASESLPIPPQIYAESTFWDGQPTFRIPTTVPQPRTGTKLTGVDARGRKNLVGALGSGVVIGAGGTIAFEAENALVNDVTAWLTSARGRADQTWAHTQAETNAGTGLAMHVRPRGVRFDDPATAPGMHYAISADRSGAYRAWMLVKFDDDRDDSCVLAVDGVPQPLEDQFSRGALCEYGLRQRWVWAHISNIELAAGEHTFSILARETGLRVDRVYLTLGDELPPVDADWAPSARGQGSEHE